MDNFANYVENYKPEYKIVSCLDMKMVLDSKQDKKVYLYEWKNSPSQKWKIYHLQGSTYQIQSVQHKAFMSVPNNKLNNKGSQLQCLNHLTSQYTYFTLESCKGESPSYKAYHIKTAGGKHLDVNEGVVKNNQMIIQWDLHGGQNQIFYFIPTSFEAQPKTQYKIVSALDESMCLDICQSKQSFNSLILYKFNNQTNQKFEISHVGGQFILNDCRSHLTLQVKNSKTGEIFVEKSNNKSLEHWEFIPCLDNQYKGKNAFYIRSNTCNRVLDIQGGTAYNKSNVALWKWTGGEHQIWFISKA